MQLFSLEERYKNDADYIHQVFFSKIADYLSFVVLETELFNVQIKIHTNVHLRGYEAAIMHSVNGSSQSRTRTHFMCSLRTSIKNSLFEHRQLWKVMLLIYINSAHSATVETLANFGGLKMQLHLVIGIISWNHPCIYYIPKRTRLLC